MPRFAAGINVFFTRGGAGLQLFNPAPPSCTSSCTSEQGEKGRTRHCGGSCLHSHETMEDLPCSGCHRLIPRQFPVFQSESSGKTTSRGSRSKLSTVLSSNRMVMTSTSGSISTLSTVLPLTWGNRRNRLVRFKGKTVESVEIDPDV